MSQRRRRQGDPTVAIGYVRVSTDDQALGAEAQRQALATWSKSKGINFMSVREDIGVSGASDLADRPGLVLALEDVRLHRAGALVALRRDRFARDPLITATLERQLDRLGASLRTVDAAGDVEGPSGDLVRGILDNVARFERALIRDRTSAALRAAQRAGRAAGGDPPYGWAKVGKILEPVPEEQRALERMRELHRSGFSCEEIARTLEREGHPPRGGRWHRRTIGRSLARRDTPGGLSLNAH